MSLAPLAYLLFQNVMSHDPADPTWLGRDRFVLSCGHSSPHPVHPALPQRVRPRAQGPPVPAHVGLAHPGAPRGHHTRGVEVTTGPLGSGPGRRGGHGDGPASPARSPRPGRQARRERVRPPRVGHRLRRRPHGGGGLRGVLARRPPGAGEPHRRLRRQPDLDRGRHRHLLQRGRRRALRRLRLGGRSTSTGGAPTSRPARRSTSRTSTPSWPRSRRASAPATDRPSCGCTRSSPGRHPTPAARARRTARPSAPTRWQPPRSSSGSTRRRRSRWTGTSSLGPARCASAARRPTRRGTSGMPRGGRPSPSAPRCWTGSWSHDCPRTSTRPSRPSSRTRRRDWRRARHPARCSARSRRCSRSCWGGSADLAESNNTTMADEPSFIPKGKQTKEWKGGPYGRTLHFGIRENAMGMILNGIALEGLTRPYGGTFLVFSDYMRPAVRLAAIQQLPVTFVWTHDSIGLGEDGPTHQPIEHLAALRAMPGLDVVRPADANETAAAWARDPPPRPDGRDRPVAPEPADRRPLGARQGRRGRRRAPTSSSTPPRVSRTSSSWPPAPRCRWPSRRG